MSKMKPEEVRRAADFFVGEIRSMADRPIRLMEVCGTHTVAIFKAGIRQLLPPEVELISGPGCPVCVTPNQYLDQAIAYSQREDVIIATFGDMLRVPGSVSSLMAEKARGADIRIVYSPMEGLTMARENPAKKVIFLAVGFETTAPTAAAVLLTAMTEGIANYYVLTAHKLVPPALRALLMAPDFHIDGFLLPGHVSAVIGLAPYRFVCEKFHVPAVVGGFDALDILQSVYMLVKQIVTGRHVLENQYRRVVPTAGNVVALKLMEQVYRPADTCWRGLGEIPLSGLVLQEQYQQFDAGRHFGDIKEESVEPRGCRCGEVLCGTIKPTGCPLFGKTCTPEHPVGACMVSVEGSCAAWYKYGAGRWQI